MYVGQNLRLHGCRFCWHIDSIVVLSRYVDSWFARIRSNVRFVVLLIAERTDRKQVSPLENIFSARHCELPELSSHVYFAG